MFLRCANFDSDAFRTLPEELTYVFLPEFNASCKESASFVCLSARFISILALLNSFNLLNAIPAACAIFNKAVQSAAVDILT